MKIIRYTVQYLAKLDVIEVVSYWSDKSTMKWQFPNDKKSAPAAIRELESVNLGGTRDDTIIRIPLEKETKR